MTSVQHYRTLFYAVPVIESVVYILTLIVVAAVARACFTTAVVASFPLSEHAQRLADALPPDIDLVFAENRRLVVNQPLPLRLAVSDDLRPWPLFGSFDNVVVFESDANIGDDMDVVRRHSSMVCFTETRLYVYWLAYDDWWSVPLERLLVTPDAQSSADTDDTAQVTLIEQFARDFLVSLDESHQLAARPRAADHRRHHWHMTAKSLSRAVARAMTNPVVAMRLYVAVWWPLAFSLWLFMFTTMTLVRLLAYSFITFALVAIFLPSRNAPFDKLLQMNAHLLTWMLAVEIFTNLPRIAMVAHVLIVVYLVRAIASFTAAAS
jgi:hypothetical protein